MGYCPQAGALGRCSRSDAPDFAGGQKAAGQPTRKGTSGAAAGSLADTNDAAAPPVALQLQQLHERVARLEQEQQESAVLIQSLAEQNAQVVQAVERLRLRNQRLTVAIAVLGAVCVCAGLLLAWTLRQ